MKEEDDEEERSHATLGIRHTCPPPSDISTPLTRFAPWDLHLLPPPPSSFLPPRPAQPGPAQVPWAPPQGVSERPARSSEVMGVLGRSPEVPGGPGTSRDLPGGPDLTGIIAQALAGKIPREVPGGGAPGGGGLPANSFPVFL